MKLRNPSYHSRKSKSLRKDSKRKSSRKRSKRTNMRGGNMLLGSSVIKPFIVYGRMTCPYTREALETLKNKKKAFSFFDIEKDAKNKSKLDRLKATNKVPSTWQTVPVIIKQNRFLGGMDDLRKLFN